MADKYLLHVTAGPSYDLSTHHPIPVNTPHPLHISSPHCDASIKVRIQNYRGTTSSITAPPPSTSPYFTHPARLTAQYSISFTLLPKTTIRGPALLFGNDFDHPVRDRLPPGFNTALRIVKWAVDPGLEGDVYADRPFLYGMAGGSVNVLRVGGKGKVVDEKGGAKGEEEDEEGVLEEGGQGEEGAEWRRSRGVPDEAGERRKWFLSEKGAGWEWEAGKVYEGDFFNGFLDFNEFALRLPGFSLSILPYLGGKDALRYVMKNKDTGDVLFVVVFTLVPKEEGEAAERGDGEEEEREEKEEVEAKDGDEDGKGKGGFEPTEDDLD